MKKLIILFTVLISISININAQIPNNGFEIWENYPDPDNPNNIYQNPDQWIGLLPNSPTTYSYSIEKNLDSYPAGTGEYSMIIKSDVSNGVDGVAASYDIMSDDICREYLPPAFPINYQPASLFLYYKYLPENGDTMRVTCNFYKNGAVIGGFDYKSPQIISDWTLLEIPIRFTTSDIPDSSTIILTTFYNTQHNGSSLYVDNLSFDTPVTSVNDNIRGDLPNSFALMQNYPNPFNAVTAINYSICNTSIVTIKLYNVSGREVATLLKEIKTPGNYTIELNTNNLPSGIYYYQMLSDSFKDIKKLVLIK